MSQRYLLPQRVQEAINTRYPMKLAPPALQRLSQGEKDQLELARQRLSWPTIISLAVKYYPLYPCRKWWQRALERCSHHKVNTATLNISYLLLTLETIKKWGLRAAYQSTKGAVNRLTQGVNKKETGDNRLTPTSGVVNIPRDPQRMTAFMARAASQEGSWA